MVILICLKLESKRKNLTKKIQDLISEKKNDIHWWYWFSFWNGKYLLTEIKLDRLIFIDNVSGLPDKSNNFTIFWQFRRSLSKAACFFLHCLSRKSAWKMILLQTEIFNAFPCTVEQSRVFRILSSNCPCETESYVPKKTFMGK